MKEEWRDIFGYEGLYQVSNLGRVKSLNYRHTGTEWILRVIKKKYGYLQVVLYKDGRAKTHLVHRLVAEAFIPNPLSLPEVNHINEIKDDNRVWNLEFCDRSYNNNYGTRNQKVAKVFSKAVLQFTLDGQLVREWPSAHEAERQGGFYQSAISSCCLGKLNTYKGYIWEYKKVS